MSKIKVKNFGPIKEGFDKSDGWIDIKKVTVFIGNNGTGKSTVAKLISTFSWLEKALVRGDFKAADVKRKNKFENTFSAYQGLKSFFKQSTEIYYEGEAYSFEYKNGRLQVINRNNTYLLPKIMYVPAERNFVSAVNTPEKLKYLPKNLYEFLDEFVRSQQELSEVIHIPINNVKFQYNQQKSEAKILGSGYSLNLSESSSGLQSAIPLFLVSKNLSASIRGETSMSRHQNSIKEERKIIEEIRKIFLNEKLTAEARKYALEYITSGIKYARFQNIVEEIEQNLFPVSQKNMLFSLLEFNNDTYENSLVITTHSPYIISYISVAIQAGYLKDKIGSNKDLISKLEKIVPYNSVLNSSDVVIYQLQNDGAIKILATYDGIPSDRNYLNQSLAESNELFDGLLEIEEELA